MSGKFIFHYGYGYGDGEGYGYGYGYCDADGYGNGYGYGDCYGYGYGYRDGYGNGYGYGYGDGHGYRDGDGEGYRDGYGEGYGYGDCYLYGYGNGYGDGDGNISGDGYGYGNDKQLIYINHSTPITAYHVINNNLTLGNDLSHIRASNGMAIEFVGEISLCWKGFHASLFKEDAIKYKNGTLTKVECSGWVIFGIDKLVCSKRKIIKIYKEVRSET